MAKVSASIQFKSNVKLVRKGLENLRTAVPKIGNHRGLEAATEIARRMAKPGKKMTYPAKWDSIKQKIKVIIMIMRKQGSLPYIRTGAHGRGWKAERTSSGAKAYTNVKGDKYLHGTMRDEHQGAMFVGRYVILRQVYDAVVAGLPKRIKESLKKVPHA